MSRISDLIELDIALLIGLHYIWIMVSIVIAVAIRNSAFILKKIHLHSAMTQTRGEKRFVCHISTMSTIKCFSSLFISCLAKSDRTSQEGMKRTCRY